MTTIIARHKVGNITAWLNGHQDRVELFAPVSAGFRSFQDTNDPNSIVVMIDTENVEILAATINDPKYDKVKAKHTVIEPITISTELSF